MSSANVKATSSKGQGVSMSGSMGESIYFDAEDDGQAASTMLQSNLLDGSRQGHRPGRFVAVTPQ